LEDSAVYTKDSIKLIFYVIKMW